MQALYLTSLTLAFMIALHASCHASGWRMSGGCTVTTGPLGLASSCRPLPWLLDSCMLLPVVLAVAGPAPCAPAFSLLPLLSLLLLPDEDGSDVEEDLPKVPCAPPAPCWRARPDTESPMRPLPAMGCCASGGATCMGQGVATALA